MDRQVYVLPNLSVLTQVYWDSRLAQQSSETTLNLVRSNHNISIINEIYRLLGGSNEADIMPFAQAWSMMQKALLDTSSSDQHKILTIYSVANALLNTLDDRAFPASRILHLHRLWNDNLLRGASGQHRYLEAITPAGEGLAALDYYQGAVSARSGGLYALAFGGTAILTSDTPAIVEPLSFIGEVYGILLQYRIDLENWSTPANLSLLTAYRIAQSTVHVDAPNDFASYWGYLYESYLQHANHAMASLSASIQTGLRSLFKTTFEHSEDTFEQ